MQEDALHALYLFSPELLLLSDVPDKRRGLEFRKPTRMADGIRGHHGFVHVREMNPPHTAYIEWRMFEAAYDDWNYLESAAYITAGMTRALLKEETIPMLMGIGYHDIPPTDLLDEAIMKDSTEDALALVSPRRLQALRQIIEAEMYDDPRGLEKVSTRFEEVAARV